MEHVSCWIFFGEGLNFKKCCGGSNYYDDNSNCRETQVHYCTNSYIYTALTPTIIYGCYCLTDGDSVERL